MRFLLPLFAYPLFGALVLSACGGGGPSTAPAATAPPLQTFPTEVPLLVSLPVEVLGEVGTVKTVTLNVSAPGSARWLLLRTHGIRYAGKASIQVNDDSWIPLSNATVEIPEPAKSFGGIGGGFATLTLQVPLSAIALKSGRNSFKFRFDKSNGLSMGYRVLGIDILAADGQSVLEQGQFVLDDPTKWEAPQGGDATRGDRLWKTADLVDSPISSKVIRARCADCHSSTGKDLKFFGYSNNSIIERAKFHGMSEQNGKDLAAYIRRLDIPVAGRPWNPPFQPGAGNTDRSQTAFSAGAGIDAVVNEDETIAAIFNDRYDRSQLIDSATGTLRRLQVNNIPISLQLPDWAHWLPEVHPKDVLGEAFGALQVQTRYLALRERLMTKKLDVAEWNRYLKDLGNYPFLFASGGGARADFTSWQQKAEDCCNSMRSSILGPSFSGTWDAATARNVYGAAVWMQVRAWELMTDFELSEYAQDAYPMGEKRAWFSERSLFDTSPFQLGIDGKDCSSGTCGGRLTGSSIGNTNVNYAYLANSWYNLQFLLNPGQRSCGGHRCMDWGYTYGWFGDLFRANGLYGGGRRLLFGLKSMDEHDTNSGTAWNGFSFATANILRPLSLNDSVAQLFWGDASHPNRKRALQIAVQVWLEKLGNWTVETWRQQNYGQSEDGANFMDDTRVVGTGSGEVQDRSLADGHWYGTIALKTLGIHPSVINASARFGAAMWPRNDWASQGVSPSGVSPANLILSRASGGGVLVGWSSAPGAQSYNVYRSTRADGPWVSVALLTPLASFVDRPSESGRTYHYSVSANSSSTESALSNATSISY